jgi:hypothetical protein
MRASDNAFPSILIEDHVDPAAPADGFHRLFIDTDEKLKMIDHASLVTDFTPGAGGSVATDAIWDAAGDLAVGTGADTAAKLTKGADGLVLAMVGGAVAWAASGAFVGAKAFNSTTQAVDTATEAALALDSEEYDTNGFHDNSTNNSRMTIPAGLGGYYLLLGYTQFSADGDGGRYMWFMNGASTRIVGMNLALQGTASIQTAVGIQTVAYLAAGDYVSMAAYHVAGNSLNLGGTNENSTMFTIVRLGS